MAAVTDSTTHDPPGPPSLPLEAMPGTATDHRESTRATRGIRLLPQTYVALPPQHGTWGEDARGSSAGHSQTRLPKPQVGNLAVAQAHHRGSHHAQVDQVSTGKPAPLSSVS